MESQHFHLMFLNEDKRMVCKMNFWKIFESKRIEEAKDPVIRSVESGTSMVIVVEAPEPKPVKVYDHVEPLDLMKVNFMSTPNKSRRSGAVRYIVLHHTGPGSFSGICKWLCNPQAKASAHYVVGKQNKIVQLANTAKYETWHAGVAEYNGKRVNNHHSIGIEICNIGIMQKKDNAFYYEYGRSIKKYVGKIEPVYGSITYADGKVLNGYYVPYPEKQIKAVVALCKGLVKKYPQIKMENIITHYDIAIPCGRKNDPFAFDIDMVREWVFYNG